MERDEMNEISADPANENDDNDHDEDDDEMEQGRNHCWIIYLNNYFTS
jgi:hypothetical protein